MVTEIRARLTAPIIMCENLVHKITNMKCNHISQECKMLKLQRDRAMRASRRRCRSARAGSSER